MNHKKKICVGVDTAQESIADNVKSGSWGVIGVMGVDEPSFAYSIGLYYKGLPELIMVGLDPESAVVILNQCAERMVNQDNHYRLWNYDLQRLVMPDAGGKYPWYGSLDSRMRRVQPLLGEAPPQETVTVTVHATCHYSGDTEEFTRTVNKFVVEDLFYCQGFVRSLFPTAKEKWFFGKPICLTKKGRK